MNKNIKNIQSQTRKNVQNPEMTKRFACSLCGFKFSKEKFMVNHLKFCQEIEDPNDRLGADRVELQGNNYNKKELKPKQLKRKHSKIGLTTRLKSPESFAFVNCDINLESELDSKLEETQVTSDVFNDLDDVKSEDFDSRKRNIVMKAEPDIEIGETIVQSEFDANTEGRVFISSMSKDENASHSKQLIKHLKTDTAARSIQYILRVMTRTGEKLYKCTKCNFTNQCIHTVKTHMERHKIQRLFRVTSNTLTKKYTNNKIIFS